MRGSPEGHESDISKDRNRPEWEPDLIATTYIDLTRHGSRFGGPMVIKAENGEIMTYDDGTDLTPTGKIKSQQFGSVFPERVSLMHPRGGDEPRHGETGEDMLAGSKAVGEARRNLGPAPILKEGRVKGSRKGKEVDYAGAGMNKDLKVYKDLINEELNRLYSGLSEADKQRFQLDAEFRATMREKAQIRGLTEAMKNENLVQRAAENEAYELMHVIALSRRGVKAKEVKSIPIVGSGLFAESLFKKALVVEDLATGEKKAGFEDINEIGGFTKQATSMRLRLERNTALGDARKLDDFEDDTRVLYEFTDPERSMIFAGKRVSFDWEKVKQLAQAAEIRFQSEK